MIDLDALLDGIETLPVSPYPLPELSKALTDPNADLNRVVEIISFDPALTAKLLQLCNSAAFSRGTPANDVAQAVNRLGFQSVYRALAALKGPQVFRTSGKNTTIDPAELWRHSVFTAMLAQMMAEDLGEEGGLYFTAGLLHDFGKSILSETAGYAEVVRRAREEHEPLQKAELATLGVEHGMVAARLLERWNFSPELVSSVRFHHQPGQAEQGKGAAIIQVASFFAHKKHPDRTQRGMLFDAAEGLRILEWKPEDLEQFSARLDSNEALSRALLRMGGA